MQDPPTAAGLCFSLLHRMTSSTCLALVSLLDGYTVMYLSPVQGLCLGCLVFLLAEATDSATIRLKLFKRVCLLYCNQRVRSMFPMESSEAAALTQLFLAVSVAVLVMLCSKEGGDLQSVLTSLMYLYGDVLDFTLQYGVFKVAVFALTVSVWMDVTKPPVNKMYAFCWDLLKIISTSLVYQGANALIHSNAVELEILECIATVAVLKQLMPSMEPYLTYLAAQKIAVNMPFCSPLMFCCVIWVYYGPVPRSGKGWLGDLAFNYVVIDTSQHLRYMPLPWIVFMVIVLQYVDYIVTKEMERHRCK